jgi:hypothetical protein
MAISSYQRPSDARPPRAGQQGRRDSRVAKRPLFSRSFGYAGYRFGADGTPPMPSVAEATNPGYLAAVQ